MKIKPKTRIVIGLTALSLILIMFDWKSAVLMGIITFMFAFTDNGWG